MRYLIVILVLMTFGCQEYFDKQKSEKTRKKYLKAKEEAISGTKRMDTIFLDYRLRMSQNEYREHSNLLIKRGKIYLERGNLYYDLKVSDNPEKDIKALLVSEFYEDQLVELRLLGECQNCLVSEQEHLLQIQLAGDINKKYGYKHVYMFNGAIDGSRENIVLIDNLQIDCSYGYLSSGVNLIYEDIRLRHLRDSIQESRLIEQATESIQDL